MDNSFANRAKIEALKAGATFNNNELCNLFQCSPQGGMRRSRRTNTLVLIRDYTGFNPVIRTIYAEYRIKTRYSAFFVLVLHKKCIENSKFLRLSRFLWCKLWCKKCLKTAKYQTKPCPSVLS